MNANALRNRLVLATAIWRDLLEEPLPRLAPGDPAEQIEALELKLVERLCETATPETASQIAEKTWDLVHDRPDGDRVKARVTDCHEQLAKLTHGRPAG